MCAQYASFRSNSRLISGPERASMCGPQTQKGRKYGPNGGFRDRTIADLERNRITKEVPGGVRRAVELFEQAVLISPDRLAFAGEHRRWPERTCAASSRPDR